MGKIYLLCIALAFVVQYHAGTSLTNYNDEFTLLAFKAHITLDPNNRIMSNWSTRTNSCNWVGVSCNHHHQRVIALNLPNMGLSGTIAPQLRNLSFLTIFNIANKSFYGQLPHEMGHLHRLKLINLQDNQLTGRIPTSLFNISNLEWLRLSGNHLHGNIPEDIGNLAAIEQIDLSNNQLIGEIPSSLGRCRNLHYIYLSSNNFMGKIPPEIGNLSMLDLLYLDHNNLTGPIPREMGDLLNLKYLNFSHNFLKGIIPPVMLNISSSISIDLAYNVLSGSLPVDMCGHLPKLDTLYLNDNQLTGQIPSSLSRCWELQFLTLSYNRFSNNINEKIGNLSKLKLLYLDSNSLEGTVPSSFGNLSMLEDLRLGDNNLGGGIPSELGNLSNLKKLYLQSNNLSGVIPPSVFNICTIQGIDFTNNSLSGHLPSSIGLGLPKLEDLYLSSNQLSGEIPNSITNASKLVNIDLSSNLFSGYVPTTLGNLRFLQVFCIQTNGLINEPSTSELKFLSSLTNCKFLRELWIAQNPFNGILPNSIGNLSISMEKFGASECRMKGKIPTGISNLSNLLELELSYNDLTGSIPTLFGGLSRLGRLSLEGNRLHGPIPNDLCRLSHVFNLNLSENEIFGLLPNCIGNLTSLRQLFLSSNKLYSTVPSSLWSLKDLLNLSLSSNSLSGSLPLGVGNLKVLIELSLSSNQLSGSIPSTIGNLQRLINLDLSNNTLEGPIPKSMDKLISLEYLDLSQNNFTGEIPNSLETLQYLKFLNVSFNRLQGVIPNQGPFLNFTAQSFMWNEALCGAARLQVLPCNNATDVKQSRARLFGLIYMLPLFGLLSAVGAIYFIKARRPREEIVPLQVDIPFEFDFAPRNPHVKISYQELARATNGFSQENLLGVGNFGSVYKGVLSDGIIVAIKVFNLQIQGVLKSFKTEFEVTQGIRHRNLVKIMGSYSGHGFKALLLKYMPKGSLEKWLHSHGYYLNISQRLSIMIDVAFALEYIHHGCSTPVVHCDLKPSNVLLDEDMVAHVADFGIAKLFVGSEAAAQTMTLATIGYMAPEYGSNGIVSTKSDVYSYGIMLMETFTGRKPTDEMFTREMNLRHWVLQALPNAMVEVVDANMLRREEKEFELKQHCLSSILELALECSANYREMRINMKRVLSKLQEIKTIFLMDVREARNMQSLSLQN